MENKYELKIDLQSGESIMTKAKYRTGDTNSAKMEVTLVNEGLVQSILGEDITWNFEKEDHTHCTQNMTNGVSIVDAENGVLLIVFENQTLACPGLVRASITFTKDGVINSTIMFAFAVGGTVNGGDLSINYITDIETKIAGWQTEFDLAENTRETEFVAIKDAYAMDMALSAENANLELVASRKGEMDLPTKITKMDTATASNTSQLANNATQLAQKLSKSDVQSQVGFSDINKNLSQIDSTMLTSSLLAMIAGTAGVNVTPSLLSVLTGMLAEKSVTSNKTDFVSSGKNKFDKSKITTGFYIWTTGELVADATMCVSDYVSVLPSTIYAIKATRSFAFFDANKVYISGGNSLTTFTSPSNAYFIRLTALLTEIDALTQFELGSIQTTYEAFKYLLSTNFDLKSFLVLLDKSVTVSKVDDLISRYGWSKNLFNFATVTTGYFVDWTSGNLEANATYGTSDWIPVLPNTAYAVPFASHCAEYNASKVYTVGHQSTTYTNTFTTGANSYFLRISPVNTNIATFQVEKSSVPTSIAQYGLIPVSVVNSIPVITPPASALISTWANKIADSIGDSVTEQNMWQPSVSAKLGFSLFNNHGVGGTKITDTTGSDTTAICRDERINLLNASADIIFAMGGINDWAQNVPLGAITDTVTSTFYGALKTIVTKLVTRYPNKRIILMTPTFGKMSNRLNWTNTYGLINNLGLTTGDYGVAIINIGRLFGVPVIDLFGNCGWNDINLSTYVSDDGGGVQVHPIPVGGVRMAEVIIGKLKTIEPLS